MPEMMTMESMIKLCISDKCLSKAESRGGAPGIQSWLQCSSKNPAKSWSYTTVRWLIAYSSSLGADLTDIPQSCRFTGLRKHVFEIKQ